MEAAFSSTASLQPLSTASALSAAALLTTALSPGVAADLQPTLVHASSLVFLAPGVKDYQRLLAGVQPGTEVHWLHSAQDAIAQITQTLLGRTGITSLHLVSHGQAGALALGSKGLSLSNLHNYSSELQSWGHALTDDADILLYGCDVAQGTIGQSFVQQFAQLTGADIAASDDRTGNAALGGNWTLEVNIGHVDAPLAFLPITMQSYGGVLDDAVFASAQQFGGGALDSNSKTFVDGAGNVYTVGSFFGTVDFDPGVEAFALTSAGFDDIFVSKLDGNGNFVWAKRIGSSSHYDQATGISVDGGGNVYTTGYFQGTADFDPGIGTLNLTSAGGTDIFVSKLDASGNFVWAKRMGSISGDYASGINVDVSGNIYTTGYYSGTVDFDPGTSTTNLTSTRGSFDIFVNKLDASGNFVWAKGMGSGSDDFGTGISVDSNGNVYTTGYYYEGTVDFDPGAGTTNLTNTGGSDTFVSKLDASGNFVWAKGMGSGSSSVIARGISVDSNGNVYTTGSFSGTADFDPGADTTNLTSTGAGSDIFVSKLDASGNFVWAKGMGGNSTDQANGISVDSNSNVYTTGYYGGTVDFDPGAGTTNLTSTGAGSDIFVSKLDASGNFVWAKGMGGNGTDQANGISVDSNGNVYTTGTFNDTVDFDPGTDTFNLAPGGIASIFLSKLDTAGNLVQAQQFTGGSLGLTPKTVVDREGSVYTVGSFYGTVDFDPGVGLFTLTSAGGADIFISKLNSSGNFVWAKGLGGSIYDDSANGISIDSNGNVYTTGSFQGTADFDPGIGIMNLTSTGSNEVFVSKLDASGNFVWAKGMGGSSDDAATGISVDTSGNVYTTGFFQGTADFDPGTGTLNLTSTGSNEVFVSKLDASGNFVWVKRMGNSYAIARDIDVDSSGNVYTTGSFYGTVDFDPGMGTTNLSSVGNSDIFVSKLDASGNFVWVKRMGVFYEVTGISVDSSGNVYTTGSFYGTVDFDPGMGTTNLTSVGNSDIFVSKLDASGNFVWAKRMGGSLADKASSISVDSSGNVYTTGYFQGTADFDPGKGTFTLAPEGTFTVVDGRFTLLPGSTTNIFLSKLSQVITPIVTLSSTSNRTEGNSGTTAYTFTVNLSNTSAETVTVNYTTADGTATVADNDYTAVSGVLTFNPGETSKTITVAVKGDTKVEQEETFLVKLLSSSNAMIASDANIRVGTIANDDQVQLLWRDRISGQNVVWQLNNSTLQSSYYLPTVADANWQIISTADFDRDGNADLLWRNQRTGENAIWQMNSTGLQSGYYLATIADLNWQLLGTDDFNGDGTADLLWHHQATGQNAIWQMSGFSTQTAALLTTVADLNWQIISTADFDNDGKADLLWRHRVTGENAIWQMNGLTTKSAFYINTVADTNWQVAGTADFDHDGLADIVWRNRATGENAIWQMNRTGLQSGYFVTAAPDVNWQLVGVADLGGDRTPDFLWRNAATGQTGLWQLSGFSYVQAYQLPNTSSDWSVRPFTLA
ncbi:DUF4347 domain-containing protein [Phormidium sp. FACHB-592]|uniref:DUF4347 domain-containing protein n=1 Tax=Stenomitos frigidus AS-A4 TaxID=2933935 RepID=A0ABV0KTK6_9CYAN|nr:DUF4347 domain-containing protein [Phormidium sp. FACHB-592]MBD2078274.1 DUF4347 domain-containing protein [Phormidium sp. FACHB-592]